MTSRAAATNFCFFLKRFAISIAPAQTTGFAGTSGYSAMRVLALLFKDLFANLIRSGFYFFAAIEAAKT